MAGGRPEGSLASPEKSHRLEMLAWLQVAVKIRKMVERQLALFSDQIESVENKTSSFNIDDQLAIMAGLTSLLTTSVRTVDSGIKAAGAGNDKPNEDPEELMRDLEGGKGA